MSINTAPARTSLKSTNARIDALEASLARIEALLAPTAPAKKTARRAPAKKASPKVVTPKVTKGASTREVLSRKDWNRTLTTKARFAGGDTYALVLAQWDDVQEGRDNGFTPDEVLAFLTK